MNKSAILFPGQGCQIQGMWTHAAPIYRQTFEAVSDIMGQDLSKLANTHSLDELSQSEMLQIIIVAHGIARFREFENEGSCPIDFLAGHSLGEITALHCAGAFDLEGTLELVLLRQELMSQIASQHGGVRMLTCQHSGEGSSLDLSEDITGNLHVVCYNSPSQLVIGGPAEEVDSLEQVLIEKDFALKTVPMSVISHHPLLSPCIKTYSKKISSLYTGKMKYEVVSCLDGLLYQRKDISTQLGNLLANPVKFPTLLDFLRKQGTTVWIELGPRPFLSFLLKQNGIEKNVFHLLDGQDISLLYTLLGKKHKRPLTRKAIERALLEGVALKNYTVNSAKEYGDMIEKPAKQLEMLHRDFRDDKTLSWDSIWAPLNSILSLKGCPLTESKAIKEAVFFSEDQ